jgi:lipopolysaccharide export system protein LptA
MYRRLRDYALALTTICVACLMYCLTVAQWIEPERKERAPGEEIVVSDLPNPYEHLFQPGDWELNSPKVLLTSQGTLLFLDYQPLENGRLEIRPCTLILYSQDAGSQQSGRPIVMRAGEGAELQFDEDVDLSRGQFGRLVGGRIMGDILIFSPPSTPDANDALELTTRNLQIERLKAWTPHPVKFRYGESHGSGHNLEMTLSPAEQIAGKAKSSVVGSIESVQLAQVDELVLQSPRRSILPSTGPAVATEQQSQPQPPVKITCDGPLKFDVARNVATFDDRVLVQRLWPKGPSDQLRCEQLAIYLDAKPTAKKESSSQAGSLDAGSVERIVAVGKPVVLEAPSQSAYTEAERLEYNLKTRQVLLKSLKDGAKVLLRRGSDEFRAPELAYEMVEGKRLGNLWAPGPGRLVSSTGEGNDKKPFAAQWQKELRIRPDKQNQLFSLIGAATIDAEGQGSFQADELHLWVLELPSEASLQPAAAIQQKPNRQTGSLPHLIPDRLLATGRVHADSPQLAADCQRLEAWFAQVPDALPQTTSQSSDELSLDPADGSRSQLREPVVRIREPQPVAEKVQHFHVAGDLIQLQVQQRGKQSSIDKITVEGNKVRITETNAAQGEEPLWLAGTKVELEGGTGPGCRIAVSGETNPRGETIQPAVLAARGIKLRSQNLKFSRRDNRVTIEQAGDMTLPLEQDALGRKLDPPDELRITWQGSMLFDGSSARFRKGVVVQGDTYQAAADELQAQLASAVDFAQPKPGQKAEIKRLVMTGGAEFDHRTFGPSDGRLQSQEHLSAHSLDVDRISGAIEGAGPGWLTRVQLGQGSLPAGDVKSPLPMASGSDELTYLRVDFRQGLTGNLHRRQIDFVEKVQAIYGPVPNWDATIEPTSRDALGARGMILTADRLGVAEFSPPGAKKSSTEMVASGNTRVEGRDFTALAHRLTYTADKTQLVLEGDGRNDAQIKHQYRDSIAAQKLMYWQDSGNVQIEGGKAINIGPAAAKPTSPRSPRDTLQPR